MQPQTLEEYLDTYGGLLAEQAVRQCAPLHDPAEDAPASLDKLLRKPYRAQAHVIAAGAQALKRQRGVVLSCQMGTGKSLLAQGVCEQHAGGKPYRALVMCPPHLCEKWEREIKLTIPRALVIHLNHFSQLTRVRKGIKPTGKSWWIMSTSKAKLGPPWEQQTIQRRALPREYQEFQQLAKILRLCPECQAPIKMEQKKAAHGTCFASEGDLNKNRMQCPQCESPLWAWTHQMDRWPMANLIHKRMKNFFNYLVADEVHQAKADESAIGQAFGSLSAACRKTICLTGTLLGGYAWHVRPMMFRIAPKTMVEEGLGWDGESLFNERYGRFERIQTETKGFGSANRQSKGKAKVTNNRYVRPGIMPTLYARHLIGQTIFLDLEDVADALPGRTEIPQGVPMDPELAEAYGYVEKAIKDALAGMGRRKNRSLLSQMLHTLLSYPDCPYGWDQIGYYTEDTHEWVHVVDPPNLSKRFLAKEIALLDLVNEQKSQGRQVWNYYTYTNKPRVGNHLEELFAKHGFSVAHMTSKISPMDREKWMAQHCPGKDVVLSHPQLVETGLDFFDKAGTYNFPTLCFYETGYNLFTLMQAAGRAWRIGQRANCETRYLYYQGTMQQKAVSLMGRKQQASRAVEGKFSAEGLAALLDGHDSIEMELAKSLTENLGDEWEVGW